MAHHYHSSLEFCKGYNSVVFMECYAQINKLEKGQKMCRNYDTEELNEILKEEGFRGDIPLDTECNAEMLEDCEINYEDELEGELHG